jgi:hypothetical protein
MKRLLLITFLFLRSVPAYAEWVLVEKNNELVEEMALYADPDLVRLQNYTGQGGHRVFF